MKTTYHPSGAGMCKYEWCGEVALYRIKWIINGEEYSTKGCVKHFKILEDIIKEMIRIQHVEKVVFT